MKKFYSLKECLFNAFTNLNICNPQDDCFMWAILEGLRRLGTWAAPVDRVKARKDHKCARSCAIRPGDTYFIDLSVNEVNRAALPKICAGCMAMILYFKDVDALPPTLYTHWDTEMKAPVKIDEGSPKER